METLSSNGGVEHYWRSTRDHSRLALCRNGKMLSSRSPAGDGGSRSCASRTSRAIRLGAARRLRSQRRRHPHDTKSAAP